MPATTTRRGAARLGTAAVTAFALVAVLAGCSQIAAIAPVGGNHETEVRYAAIDVLQGAAIDILTAPVCATADDERAVRCSGDTLDGEAIEVVSPADAPETLSVTVGGRTLYAGSIDDVLEAAMRG